VFGPLAVLLVGFDADAYSKFQNLMRSMEADMVPIYCAGSDTMAQTLEAALEQSKPGFQEPPAGARMAVFRSGMYTSEVRNTVQNGR
jgi:hypothetical protein